ncbi:MAG TPA: hypothetical protein VH142_20830 [Polyangiaceae bacterium]|nr:hypothetical protein [Polyangiaceae bacterium]
MVRLGQTASEVPGAHTTTAKRRWASFGAVAFAGAIGLLPLGCGSSSSGGGNANGGASGGGALGSGGSVDSGPTSSSGGGASGTGGATALPPASPECMMLVAHETDVCGTFSEQTNLQSCIDATTLYAPQGCGAAWNAYVTCATTATIDCTKGPMGCDTQKSAYFACQQKFTSATGCNRSAGNDSQCLGQTPYGFFCNPLPSNCFPLTTAAANAACCSAFPPQ